MTNLLEIVNALHRQGYPVDAIDTESGIYIDFNGLQVPLANLNLAQAVVRLAKTLEPYV